MIDITDSNIVRAILSEMENSEERDRKVHAFDAYQVYAGNLKPYVEDMVRSKRPRSYSSYTIPNVSISKMVVNKIAKSYKQSPIRTVTDINGEISPEKTEYIQELYQDIMANAHFRENDQIFNLQREGLFWVNWLEKKQQYQLMALAPYEYSIIRDKDTGDLEVVILNYGNTTVTSNANSGDGMSGLLTESQADSAAESKVYAMWSKDQHVVIRVEENTVKTADGQMQVQKDITFVPIDGNPNMVNPLGMLPFVYISKDMSFDKPIANPITYQTILYNYLLSELLTTANIQGSGILTFKYPEKYQGKMDMLTTGLTEAIELPQSGNPDDSATDVNYVSPSPNLQGQMESYMVFLKQALAENGIVTSQGVGDDSQTFTSGIQMMIANADVQNIVEENQAIYSMLEKKAFDILKAYDSLLGINALDNTDSINVSYQKPRLMVTETETINNIKILMELGLIDKAKALQKLDPNLSKEDAQKEIEEMEQQNADMMNRVLRNGNTQTNQNFDIRFVEGSEGSEEES
jgi:hypothetical protein